MSTLPFYNNTDEIEAHSIEASLRVIDLIKQSFEDNKKMSDASQGQYVRYHEMTNTNILGVGLKFVDLNWSKIYPRMEDLPHNLLEMVFPEVCAYFMEGKLSPLSKSHLFVHALNDKNPHEFMSKLPIYWGKQQLSLKDFHEKIDEALLSIESPAKKQMMTFPSSTHAENFLNHLKSKTSQQIPNYFKHHVLKTQGEEFPLLVQEFVRDVANIAQAMGRMVEKVLPSELGGGLLSDQANNSVGFKIK